MKPDPKLAHRVVEGRVFVMDPRCSTLHSLSETGTFIWKKLCGGASDSKIARALAEEFEVDPKQAADDVRAFLAELRAKDLLADDG
ncbi:MAG: PqqD family protein [Bradyrhizobium sp.]|nr:PqqD family protein [Bradyrhizobium sp.]